MVRICIEKQIGFAYKPVFSKESLDEFTKKVLETDTEVFNTNYTLTDKERSVNKIITSNDVSCNLISVPSFIVNHIKNNDTKQKLQVIINNDKYELTYSPARKYLYVPNSKDTFQKYGIIQSDGSVLPKEAVWTIDENQVIVIKIK